MKTKRGNLGTITAFRSCKITSNSCTGSHPLFILSFDNFINIITQGLSRLYGAIGKISAFAGINNPP